MPVEKFHASATRSVGVLGMMLGVVVLFTVASNGVSRGEVPWLLLVLLLTTLAWASMVRPQVRLTEETLVLRNMLDDISLPVAGVDDVRVRQVMVVRSGDRKFVSPAVSRSLREVIRERGAGDRDPVKFVNFVEDRIRARAVAARERGETSTDVRRSLAWPEIVVVAGSAVGFVVTLFVL